MVAAGGQGQQDAEHARHRGLHEGVRLPLLTLLYYTILYYTILYYTILYYTILYYFILYYTILYYTIRVPPSHSAGSRRP